MIYALICTTPGDDYGTLIGTAHVPEGCPAPDGAVPCPDGCDLPPGLWRWDGARFVPRTRGGKSTVAPGMDAALAGLIRAVKARRAPPPETLEWLAAWEKSFDAAGPDGL